MFSNSFFRRQLSDFDRQEIPKSDKLNSIMLALSKF